MTILGGDTFVEGVEACQRALDDARDQLAQLRSRSVLVDDLTNGDLLQAWPQLSTPDKRRLLSGLLDRVLLYPAGRRGRAAPPIEGRTKIILRGRTRLT